MKRIFGENKILYGNLSERQGIYNNAWTKRNTPWIYIRDIQKELDAKGNHSIENTSETSRRALDVK